KWAERPRQQAADQAHGLVGVLGRGGASGPDCPNWLVGDRQVDGALDVDAVERGAELPRDDLLRPPEIVLLEGLAEGQDDLQVVTERRLQLAVELLVRLVEELAP